ncbi:MAG: hypothetical protein KJ018_18990, partial [Burkholderiales bacterium]|nr:hypothetical protein [Burkholderiales bacterium]
AGGEEERLPDTLRALPRLRAPLVAVGSETDRRVAVEALRAGASDYFALPQDVDALRAWVRDQSLAAAASRGAERFASTQRDRYRFEGILGASRAMEQAVERAA